MGSLLFVAGGAYLYDRREALQCSGEWRSATQLSTDDSPGWYEILDCRGGSELGARLFSVAAAPFCFYFVFFRTLYSAKTPMQSQRETSFEVYLAKKKRASADDTSNS